MTFMTFEKVLDQYIDYLSVKGLKITTRNMVKRKIINHFLVLFKDKNIQNFNKNDFLKWQKYIIDLNYSKSFENNIQTIVKCFFDYINKFYDIENIASQVGNFKSKKKDKRIIKQVWTCKEYKKFIKSVDNIVYHALFHTLYSTGIRKGEALALSFEDIKKNGLNYYLCINSTLTKELIGGERKKIAPKSDSSIRKIGITRNLFHELKKLQKYYTTTYGEFNTKFYVFGGIKPIACSTLDRKKDYYCSLAGVKRIRIHDFRHSHATMLYHKHINYKSIQERLGHADIATTLNTYVHMNFKDEKRVLHKLLFLRL